MYFELTIADVSRILYVVQHNLNVSY